VIYLYTYLQTLSQTVKNTIMYCWWCRMTWWEREELKSSFRSEPHLPINYLYVYLYIHNIVVHMDSLNLTIIIIIHSRRTLQYNNVRTKWQTLRALMRYTRECIKSKKKVLIIIIINYYITYCIVYFGFAAHAIPNQL